MGVASRHVQKLLLCSMTDGAQQALRRTMEVYSKTTRFALACNNSDQIIGVFTCQCVCYLYVSCVLCHVPFKYNNYLRPSIIGAKQF